METPSRMRKPRTLREVAATKDGLPRKAFAYAPTADPSTWKLPFLTAAGAPDPDRLPGAVASLSEGGFRGQKADIPDSAAASVKRKLRAAYRKWKGADAEIPDTIAEAAFERDGYTIREAVVLVDQAPVMAQVVVAPNGDTLVLPMSSYDGFDGRLRVPVAFEAATADGTIPADQQQEWHDSSASWDVEDAAEILTRLVRLKKGEGGEPDAEPLQAAIDQIVDFIRAEAGEIGQPPAPGEKCDLCNHDVDCDCTVCGCSAHEGALSEAAAFLADPERAPMTPGALAVIREAADHEHDPILEIALWEDPDDEDVRAAIAGLSEAAISEAGPAYIFGRKNPNYTPAKKTIESYGDDENKKRDAKVKKSPYYKAFLKGNPGVSPREFRHIWLAAARSGAKAFAAFKKAALSGTKLKESGEVDLAEVGRRNSKRDQSRIQQTHDLMHDLGAVHEKGGSYAGMSESGDVVEVRIEATAKPETVRFRESAADGGTVPTTLREADPLFDDSSQTVWITPIKAGWGNTRDNNYYPASTLREATLGGHFNNKKMFRDHPRKSDEKDLPERSVKDWFATTREAVWDEARQEPRVPVKVHDDAVWRQWRDAPEQVAYSVLGGGSARPGSVDGRTGRIIESIVKVGSIDWVTEAGAGGAIAFAESAAADEEFDMDLENLTAAQLREANPALYAALTGTKGVETGDEKPTPTPPTPTPPTPPTPTPVAEAAPGWFTAAMAPVVTRLDAIEQRDQAAAGATRITEAKAAAAPIVKDAVAKTTLPGHVKTIVAAKFAEAALGEGQTFATEAALREAVAAEVASAEALVKPFMQQSRVTGLGPVASSSGDGTIREAVVADLTRRWGPDQIPAKGKHVWTAEEIGSGQPAIAVTESRVDDDIQPPSAGASSAPISDGSQAAQDRIASRMGVGL
jgi:hypothetical protein